MKQENKEIRTRLNGTSEVSKTWTLPSLYFTYSTRTPPPIHHHCGFCYTRRRRTKYLHLYLFCWWLLASNPTFLRESVPRKRFNIRRQNCERRTRMAQSIVAPKFSTLAIKITSLPFFLNSSRRPLLLKQRKKSPEPEDTNCTWVTTNYTPWMKLLTTHFESCWLQVVQLCLCGISLVSNQKESTAVTWTQLGIYSVVAVNFCTKGEEERKEPAWMCEWKHRVLCIDPKLVEYLHLYWRNSSTPAEYLHQILCSIPKDNLLTTLVKWESVDLDLHDFAIQEGQWIMRSVFLQYLQQRFGTFATHSTASWGQQSETTTTLIQVLHSVLQRSICSRSVGTFLYLQLSEIHICE